MGAIIKIILQILAGMGIAWGADKILPPKVPDYEPIKPFGSTIRTVLLVLALTIGTLLVTFVGKKLNIKLLKT